MIDALVEPLPCPLCCADTHVQKTAVRGGVTLSLGRTRIRETVRVLGDVPATVVCPRSATYWARPARCDTLDSRRAMNEQHRNALRRVKSFASLSDAECDGALACFRWRALDPGDVLFRHGHPGDTLALVSAGLLAVRLPHGAGPDADLCQVGPGELLGEMSCIDPAPRSATVVALTETTVGELSRDGLTAMRSAAPDAYSALVGAVISDVTRRLREADARIEQELAPATRSARPHDGSTASQPEARSDHDSTSRPRPSQPERSGLMRFLDRLRGNG